MILNCSSLMVSGIEHIFMYIMGVCMFSLEKCVLMPLAHFVVMFLGVVLKFFFVYFVFNPLSDTVCKYLLFYLFFNFILFLNFT